jgi:hypothetical protein
LPFVVLAWLSGGTVRVVDGVIEVHGGGVSWLLRRRILGFVPAMARTLGHVIVGADQNCLDLCRVHERTHVKQFERWGPLFLVVYPLASLSAWARGRDPYLDNRYEREAISAAEGHGQKA